LASEYTELRNQYLKAKAPLELAESQYAALVAETQKQNPHMSLADVRGQHVEAWQAIERATPAFEQAERLLATKLKLLELDRDAATLARNSAKQSFEILAELAKQGEVALCRLTKNGQPWKPPNSTSREPIRSSTCSNPSGTLRQRHDRSTP
jgi:hypothetical protein